MPQRNCTKTIDLETRANRCIIVPSTLADYQAVVGDACAFRNWMDGMIKKYPELFPAEIGQGYALHDLRTSKKLPEVRLRRICLKERSERGKKQTYTVMPSAVLPYLVGYTDDVEKVLFLRRFGVPYWALTYVFGRDDAYWYRLESHLGGYNLVQTTVKDPDKLPKHLLADEKITWLNGEEVEVAVTVGEDCVLGAALALQPDIAQLFLAYATFHQEVLQLKRDYSPETVNLDGWHATRAVWAILFPLAVLIQCVLHAYIKIRDCSRLAPALRQQVADRFWHAYRAPDAATFRQRMDELLVWAKTNTTGILQETILKLEKKVERFVPAYDHPLAHRTSTMLDRQVDPLSRCLDRARFFHGHAASANRIVRAWALTHNFRPFCPRAKIGEQFRSPFHRLNGFVYHDNWLHNLLIASSRSEILS
jgi:hypothetical protein